MGYCETLLCQRWRWRKVVDAALWRPAGAARRPPPANMNYLHQTSFGIGVLGVLVICFGVASGVFRFLRSEIRAARGANADEDRKHLRHLLGYYLLLGLEFLIAADIIETLMKPTPQDLLVLGAIIVIRTVISYSLNAELQFGQKAEAK